VKLYAVRVFVHDWDAAIEFYESKLGLERKFYSEEFGWAEFDVGGPVFGVERVAKDDADGSKHVGRFLGVSLQVDDIQKTYEELTAKGVEFTSPPEKQSWGGTLAFVKDPDGNEFILLGM